MEKKLFKTPAKSVRQADAFISSKRAASSQIPQQEAIRLSPQGQEIFAKILRTPPKPSPALKRAFARHRKLIRPG